MVGEERIELSLLAKHDFESCASTSSAIRPHLFKLKSLCLSCVWVLQNYFITNYLVLKKYCDRFKLLCQKNGLIMSVFIENAIRRFVDGRWLFYLLWNLCSIEPTTITISNTIIICPIDIANASPNPLL